MKHFYFFCRCFLSFLTILYAIVPAKSDYLEKEKAIALLETAEDFLSKAEESYPTCKEDLNSTDQSEYNGRKSLFYIEISKKLISDVRENFPTYPKIIENYDKPNDCCEILASGRNESGVYSIWPSESNTTGKSLLAYCDMETDGGGWTVIQRRGKFAVQQDFHRDWETYKNGFGKITEEFWLGNENIRVLCHKGCEIRFDLQDKIGQKRFAVYQFFALWSSKYTLYIGGYTGNAGDAMKYLNHNIDFSTKDKGNARKVNDHYGGWWYTDANEGNWCNPNGFYQSGKNNRKTVFWWEFREYDNLDNLEIKVRPK